MVVSAWSWVRIDFWGQSIDLGVVHGRGFEYFNFGVNGCVVHGLGFEFLLLWVNGGVVVHGSGFESLMLGVNGGECMVEGSNFKKKLLLVFEVGSFWHFFLVSADDPHHVSFECWWVLILDTPIYNVLFQNLLFLPSKKIHNKPGGDRVHVCVHVMGWKWGHTGVVHVASLP
jgi:hypothetical protein